MSVSVFVGNDYSGVLLTSFPTWRKINHQNYVRTHQIDSTFSTFSGRRISQFFFERSCPLWAFTTAPAANTSAQQNLIYEKFVEPPADFYRIVPSKILGWLRSCTSQSLFIAGNFFYLKVNRHIPILDANQMHWRVVWTRVNKNECKKT